MNNFAQLQRGGMQVHAVPESERYVDVSGKRMPWAYERADLPELSPGRREPAEKGPFGRSTRRRGTSRSRSKTAEPRREEDRIRAENTAAEDAIFGKLKVEPREKDKGGDRAENGSAGAAATIATAAAKEPTEVLLYGFGEDAMWSAIDWFERASGGIILEDYERQPPGKQEPLTRSLSRATAQKSLSRAFLRRKNTFQGGSHWIKVTFDSAEAAGSAISKSPHLIKGHMVTAEPFRGTGPPADEPVFASTQGAQITSTLLPATFSTNPQEASPSSETVSSATVNGQDRQRDAAPPRIQFAPNDRRDLAALQSSSSQSQPQRELVQRQSRIHGATRAVLLPAEQALLQRQPRQSWAAWLGGGREVISSTLPKRDDGQFDWNQAGLYWRIFYWIDLLLGTDLCGLKSDE